MQTYYLVIESIICPSNIWVLFGREASENLDGPLLRDAMLGQTCVYVDHSVVVLDLIYVGIDLHQECQVVIAVGALASWRTHLRNEGLCIMNWM
jgi:hypothetical protein